MGEPVYNNPNIKKPVLDLSNIENLLTPEQLLSKEKIKARELQSDVASKQSKLKSYAKFFHSKSGLKPQQKKAS